MAKLMIGTEEVIKIMMGTEEVSLLSMGGETIPVSGSPTPTPTPVYSAMPFTIEALESGNITLSIALYNSNGRSFYVSINGGAETLHTVDTANTALTINVVSGDTIAFRASSEQNGTADSASKKLHFGGSARHNAYGNILSLSYPDYVSKNNFVGDLPYHSLFHSDSKLVSAENLILPTVANKMFCYSYMFYNCSNLIAAPILPATSLGTNVYANMFENCSSLTNIVCYADGFGSNSCSNWVRGISATGTFVKKQGVTWASGDSGIPNGWTVVEV